MFVFVCCVVLCRCVVCVCVFCVVVCFFVCLCVCCCLFVCLFCLVVVAGPGVSSIVKNQRVVERGCHLRLIKLWRLELVVPTCFAGAAPRIITIVSRAALSAALCFVA